MRIVHVSDIHIRNLKYHDEYKNVFEDFYKHLDELKPDLIINTGDTAHTKTQISPEFVEMCSEHIREVAEYAPYHILLGNHDLNLVNPNRQDAISPIVDSIGNSVKHHVTLHKKSGIYSVNNNVDLFIYSCADQSNYPDPLTHSSSSIKIGLYHGSLLKCEIDNGWIMAEADNDLSLFTGLDFVLLGDIHKHQFMDVDKRVAYAGSMIQQNFGEDPDKGFLVWDIENKDEWDVRHIKLHGNNKFFTIRLNDDFSIPDIDIERDSRIRIISPCSFTLADQQEFEKSIKEKFKPHSVISIAEKTITKQDTTLLSGSIAKMENLRDIRIQEKLLKKFFNKRKVSDDVLNKILEINKKYQVAVEKDEDIVRNVQWKLERIAWNNMFNYGENNFIDFSKLKGITGIFAENSAGKSSIIDVILETLFDRITKGSTKNIYMVNDNKDSAQMIAGISVGDNSYILERTIEKIKYGKKNLEKEKEWGKTTVNFYKVDNSDTISLNDILRPGTEKAIRKHIGSYDDFVLTALLSQGRDDDIIKCKDTERRKILSKFMDLDIFEQKEKMSREESKQYFQRLKDFDSANLSIVYATEKHNLENLYDEFKAINDNKDSISKEINSLRDSIVNIETKKESIDFVNLDLEVIKKKIIDLKLSLNSLINNKVNDKKQYDELYKNVVSREEKLSKIDITIVKNALLKIEEIKASVAKKLSDIQVFETNLLYLKRDASLLDEVPCGDLFPTCKLLAGAFKSKSKINDLEIVINNLKNELVILAEDKDLLEKHNYQEKLQKYNDVICDLKKQKSNLTELTLKLENYDLKIEVLERGIDDIYILQKKYYDNQDSLEKNKEIDNNIKEIKKQLDILILKKEDVKASLMDINKKIGAKESIINRIGIEIEALEDIRVLCDAHELYIEAMGKKGIAYHILIEKLPILNEEINKILSVVADFNVFIEHNENENSIRLYLQYGDYKGRPLELGGGAEKMLSSIAIRAALINITNLPKTNMFIIDEGFGSLDSKYLDNINRMFDYLRSVFDHVLIISHIDELKDIVDNNIEISSDNERYSHIEVC